MSTTACWPLRMRRADNACGTVFAAFSTSRVRAIDLSNQYTRSEGGRTQRNSEIFTRDGYPPHGPGPPQRPHIPGAGAGDDLEASAPTAKTLSSRAVSAELHDGQLTLVGLAIERWRCSNLLLHFRQMYSYIGKSVSWEIKALIISRPETSGSG